MEPTQQSLPQQHRGLAGVHSRRSSITRPRDFWLARQCIHITSVFYGHHSICIHTTWIRIHTVHVLMHTLNHHTPYAYTLICTHIQSYYLTFLYLSYGVISQLVMESVVSCAMCLAACWQLLLLNASCSLYFCTLVLIRRMFALCVCVCLWCSYTYIHTYIRKKLYHIRKLFNNTVLYVLQHRNTAKFRLASATVWRREGGTLTANDCSQAEVVDCSQQLQSVLVMWDILLVRHIHFFFDQLMCDHLVMPLSWVDHWTSLNALLA